MEEVLHVLDCKSASDLLLNLRAHLAAVGVTRLADVLRWEALVYISLQETTGVPQDSVETVLNTGAGFQPGHCDADPQPPAVQCSYTVSNRHQLAAEHAAEGGKCISEHPQDTTAASASPQPSGMATPAGCPQKRRQAAGSSAISHVPLAKRMRDISGRLLQQQQQEQQPRLHASNERQAVHAARSHAHPVVQVQQAGSDGTGSAAATVSPADRRQDVSGTIFHTASTAVCDSAGGRQPADVASGGHSASCVAPHTPLHNAIPQENSAPPNAQSVEDATIPKTVPQYGAKAASVRHASHHSPQQIEAPKAIPAALLQRWLSYKPPPGHSAGLQLSQCVPGSKFLVDSFSRVAQKSGTRSFFLTHFHYDHYIGLSKTFSSGTIYCTPETARLVQLKLKVPAKRIKTANIREPFQVSGCTVTFVPANHCPGAVMIVFERPCHAPVLHCGDCRYHVETFQSCPELQAVRRRAILHLDTTYCSQEHQFPLQAEVVTEVVQLVRAALQRKRAQGQRPPLLVFGSYTIGKERLFMEVAVAMNMKVYVEQDKWNVLRCLDMRVCERKLLTRNMNEAGIHVVPMRRIRFDRMRELLSKHGGFGAVIAFKPTGWTFNGHAPAPAQAPPALDDPPVFPTGHHTTEEASITRGQNVLTAGTCSTIADRCHAADASAAIPGQHTCSAYTAMVAAPTAAANDDDDDDHATLGDGDLDADDEALFLLDTHSVKENISGVAGEKCEAAEQLPNPDAAPHSPVGCGQDELLHDGMFFDSGVSGGQAFDLDTENVAAAHGYDSDGVIDLCFSQCSPRPALQQAAARGGPLSDSRARVRSPPRCKSAAPLQDRCSNVAPPAAVQHPSDCFVPGGATRGDIAPAGPPVVSKNALTLLMQPARRKAQDSRATSTVPKSVTNALSIMMQSAKENAKEQLAVEAGSGAGGQNLSRGRKQRSVTAKSGRATVGDARNSVIDRSTCAPWVAVKSSGPVHILEVPYSEHSSFAELRDFVGWLQPAAVVPTVGGSATATPTMLRMLGGA